MFVNPLSRTTLSLRPACGGLAAPSFQSGVGFIMERNILFAKQSFAQRIGRNPISLAEGLAKIRIVCKAETSYIFLFLIVSTTVEILYKAETKATRKTFSDLQQ